MYDKLKLWVATNTTTQDFSQYLSNVKEQISHDTGETSYFGNFKGLKVSVYASGISIIGSLSKVLYPNNIYPLDRHTTPQAIKELSDYLHLNVDEAKVTELEFGTQFVMQYPVEYYLPKLGDMPKLMRYMFTKNTLYYQTKGKQSNKTFIFYDKKADAAAKKMDLPKGFEDCNLLKYEMRFKGRLPKLLGVPELKASTLYDKNFYRDLMKRYTDAYFSIDRDTHSTNMDFSQIKTVSDGFELFVAKCINQQEKGEISAYLAELKANNVFSDRKSYTRLKNKFDEICQKDTSIIHDKHIKELDDAIKNLKAYI